MVLPAGTGDIHLGLIAKMKAHLQELIPVGLSGFHPFTQHGCQYTPVLQEGIVDIPDYRAVTVPAFQFIVVIVSAIVITVFFINPTADRVAT